MSDHNTEMTIPEAMPLRLEEAAPQFTAPTTHGEKSLSDYKGKWLILFSHPADFTPVCTTEFIAFAQAAEEFRGMNTELIGLSIDSVYSHIAWERDIKEKFGVEVTFPIIADLSMDVARKYGMIHPGAGSTSAVRAVFVIDPEQKLRAMIYYPMTTGRSIAEIKRLIQGLQLNAKHQLATPEGWQPGQACIVPPPGTAQDANARVQSDFDVTTWYFSKTADPSV
jgi:peroxiredoxin (alkyl hydroperoxide reductase subunit C)